MGRNPLRVLLLPGSVFCVKNSPSDLPYILLLDVARTLMSALRLPFLKKNKSNKILKNTSPAVNKIMLVIRATFLELSIC